MLDAFRRARTLSFESEYIWETNGDEIGRSTYVLMLKKPCYARLESRSGDGKRRGSIFVDGRDIWIYWPTGRPAMPGIDSSRATNDGKTSFMRKRAGDGVHSIGREASNLGTGMTAPIIDPSIFHGFKDPMDGFLDEVRSIGSATVDGELCDIVVAEYEARQRTRTFWIARSDGLPRRLIETFRLGREIIKREHWRAVTVNAPLADSLFAWKPPEDWVEFRLPTLADGLLPPGSAAPDFEITLLDGSRFMLSEQRGKVVWICFWRLACPPCRIELPHLDRLHERYGRNGFVVVGVNFADAPANAIEYLRTEKIAFPNAADTSAAVRDLYYRRYQTLKGQSAVPLNYIVDPAGRIADAWYGFEKKANAGSGTLRRLGIIR
jgi:peroxiredoxin/outer membrane lipoprotein-sorting protein